MWNYATADDAFVDALRLSEGMSNKNAMADLPLGGGKAVIWGNAKTDKTPELFRALGRAINTLNGTYWSAEDVGVSVYDMAYAAEETKYVAGLPTGKAASGDPSPVTAKGVFLGIKATALRAFGTDDLNGRHVAVQGVGHVGAYVCGQESHRAIEPGARAEVHGLGHGEPEEALDEPVGGDAGLVDDEEPISGSRCANAVYGSVV